MPQPQPKDGQVLVKVRAAGLNRGEFIAGHGLTPPGAAKAAGQEAAGEVVGSGERVMGRAPGAFAEYVLMDRREALPIPAQPVASSRPRRSRSPSPWCTTCWSRRAG